MDPLHQFKSQNLIAVEPLAAYIKIIDLVSSAQEEESSDDSMSSDFDWSQEYDNAVHEDLLHPRPNNESAVRNLVYETELSFKTQSLILQYLFRPLV